MSTMSSTIEQQLRAVDAAMLSGDLGGATAIARRALLAGLEHPHFLTLVAYREIDSGAYEEALVFATRASVLAPRNVDALNAKGTCLLNLGRTAEAVATFDKALQESPDDLALHFTVGVALEAMKDFERAVEEFERVLMLDPARADVASRIAFLSAKRGDMGRAREYGLRALALDKMQAFAGFAVALAGIDAGDFAAAERRLMEIESLPSIGRVIRGMAQSILGDALDGAGRPADAFAAYAKSGTIDRELYAPEPGVAAEMARARAKRFAAHVSKAPSAARQAKPAPAPVRVHAFVLGFECSGTAPLARALASLSSVTVLEEKRTLTESNELVASDRGLDRLSALDEAGLAPYREAYWRRVAELVPGGLGEALVEEMPFYSELMFLLAKLFPAAKFVFAIRDPRDVVFSSFRRRFAVTPQTYELLTLEGAAAYYDAVMSLAEIQRRALDLPVHYLKHEDLIADVDGECRKLCAFLDVEYDPDMARTVRALKAEKAGEWRPYAAEMARVLPLLSPWVDKFGYGN